MFSLMSGPLCNLKCGHITKISLTKTGPLSVLRCMKLCSGFCLVSATNSRDQLECEGTFSP